MSVVMEELDIYMKEPNVENAIDGDLDFSYSSCKFSIFSQYTSLLSFLADKSGLSVAARVEKHSFNAFLQY